MSEYELSQYEPSDYKSNEYDFSTREYVFSHDDDVTMSRALLDILARRERDGHSTSYLDHIPAALVDCVSRRFPLLRDYPIQKLENYVVSTCARLEGRHLKTQNRGDLRVVFLTAHGHSEVDKIPSRLRAEFREALPHPSAHMANQISGNVSHQYSRRLQGIESLQREYNLSPGQSDLRIGEYVFNLKDYRTASQAFLCTVHDLKNVNLVARLDEMPARLAACLSKQYPALTEFSDDPRWKSYVGWICAQQENRYLKTESSQGSRAIHLIDPGRNEVDRIPTGLREQFQQAMVPSYETGPEVEREAWGPRVRQARGPEVRRQAGGPEVDRQAKREFERQYTYSRSYSMGRRR
jgi:hypothetical protein